MGRQTEYRSWKLAAHLTGALWLIAFIHLVATGAAVAAGPFAGFSGSWAGSGHVVFKNGATERIRCRARYSTSSGDNVLQQRLQCASTSYQFELNTDIKHSNGTISGVWSESVNNVSGQVSGQASDGQIRAVVSGSGMTASVLLRMSANAQAVRMRPQDEKVREVAIELRRK